MPDPDSSFSDSEFWCPRSPETARNEYSFFSIAETNGGELMELDGGGSTVGLQSFIESTLFTDVGAKVSRSGNKVRRSWRGNSVVQGGNSSRTRPNTRSNQFASPETMSSPLLSEPIELTAPGLISGIDAVQVVLPLSRDRSFYPPFLSLSIFSLLAIFTRNLTGSKFFTKKGEEKKFRKIRKYFLSKTSKSG